MLNFQTALTTLALLVLVLACDFALQPRLLIIDEPESGAVRGRPTLVDGNRGTCGPAPGGVGVEVGVCGIFAVQSGDGALVATQHFAQPVGSNVGAVELQRGCEGGGTAGRNGT